MTGMTRVRSAWEENTINHGRISLNDKPYLTELQHHVEGRRGRGSELQDYMILAMVIRELDGLDRWDV